MVKCNDIIVLTCGDKLKAIRKKYGLKQEQIAGKDVTRNLISEIETNKASLTKKTAEIVMDNLNKIAKKEKFEVTETVDYLIEGELSQANKVLNKYINELKTLIVYKDGSFIKKLKEAEEFLINWNIKDKKITIYELAGDYFYNQNEIYKSINYYERALELTGKVEVSEILLLLLRKLSMIYTYVDKYRESIDCCNFALEHFKDMPNEYYVIFLFNKGLGCKKLCNFDDALESLNQAEELADTNDLNKIFKIKNVKANCLYRMNLYEESLHKFEELLIIYKNDLEKQLHIRINMISNYIELNNKEKVLEHLKFLTDYLPKLNANSTYISEFYHETGKIYGYFHNDELEGEYYNKVLELSQKQKNCNLFYKIAYSLIELYTRSNNIIQISKIKDRIFMISNRYEKINEKIMILLMAFYSKNNKNNMVNEIADFSLNLM